MTNIEIVDALAEKIVSDIRNYYAYAGKYESLLEPICAKNVIVGPADEDFMNGNVMFYVIPDEEPAEPLTTSSYLNNWTIDIFILCKGKSRSKLVKTCYSYYEALIQMLMRNQTLDGIIDGLAINGHEFMPDVDGNNNVVGIRAGITLVWEKDF